MLEYLYDVNRIDNHYKCGSYAMLNYFGVWTFNVVFNINTNLDHAKTVHYLNIDNNILITLLL